MITTLFITLLMGGSFTAGDFPNREACERAAATASVVFNSARPPTSVHIECRSSSDRVTCTSVGSGMVNWVFCGRDSDQPAINGPRVRLKQTGEGND